VVSFLRSIISVSVTNSPLTHKAIDSIPFLSLSIPYPIRSFAFNIFNKGSSSTIQLSE
jgi:hypothetical protein